MSKLKDVAKTVYLRSRREANRSNRTQPDITEQERSFMAKLKWHGYVVLPNFYSTEKCTLLRQEMDEIFVNYASFIWKDPMGSDSRAYAAETVSPLINEYNEDPLINRLARLYMGPDHFSFFTLANKVVPEEGNLGSGQGWHRDTPHERQFKSLLYLSDVGEGNGAFEYVPGSHRLRFFVRTIMRADVHYGQSRFTDEEVRAIMNSSQVSSLKFHAPAGTLLLIDSSGIHRGSPIETGIRYALTNYFYDKLEIEKMRAAGKFTGYFVNREP